jgi:hypothetical protein
MGEEQCAPACPRGGERSLRSGVASPYHDYLEAFWEQHDFKGKLETDRTRNDNPKLDFGKAPVDTVCST